MTARQVWPTKPTRITILTEFEQIQNFECRDTKEQKKMVLEKACPDIMLKKRGVPGALSVVEQVQWLERGVWKGKME